MAIDYCLISGRGEEMQQLMGGVGLDLIFGFDLWILIQGGAAL
jgi:hypothetical protein